VEVPACDGIPGMTANISMNASRKGEVNFAIGGSLVP
jgi:hypothetical protein